MNTLAKPLVINYLAIAETSEVNSLIESKFTRLKRVYKNLKNCQIKIANIAQHKKTTIKNSYLVSISLDLPDGVHLYTLRSPQTIGEDSLSSAISDAFARIYRQLIELQFEKDYVVH